MAKYVDPGWRGSVILFAASLLSLGGLWGAAALLNLNRDRVLWAGLGTFLAVMTLTRPWWFWENYKARWLRGLIGDEATASFYLAVAAVDRRADVGRVAPTPYRSS